MMLCENDRYTIPKEVLEMNHEQIKVELKKAQEMMVAHSNKKPKKQIRRGITFNFDS